MLETKDLERFVDRFGDHAYNFAFNLCGNEPEARELVQDAFVKLFDKADQYEPGQSLDSWYMTIMKNIFLDERRRWRWTRTISLDMPIGEDGLTVADALPDRREPALIERLERQECVDGVRRAMAALAPELRAVVSLIDIEGMGYDEAAQVLEWPPGTVRSRLFRARAVLRDRLLASEGVA
jgi:RNA polymerase sigma-70 factor (ECF subfamily)